MPLNLLAKATEKSGVNVRRINPAEFKDFSTLRDEIVQFAPHFCLAQNDYAFEPHDPVLKELDHYLSESKIPTFVWYVDDPAHWGSYGSILKFSAPPFAEYRHYLYADREFADFFKQRQLPASHFMSAADEEVFKKSPETPLYDLSMVAHPGMPTDIELFTIQEVREMLVGQIFDAYYRFISRTQFYATQLQQGATHLDLKNALAQKFGESIFTFFSTPYRDQTEYSQSRTSLLQWMTALSPSDAPLMTTLLTGRADNLYSTGELIEIVHRLQKFNIHLFGTELWKKYFSSAYIHPGRLDSDELYKTYSASRINLCPTKRQFSTAVVERPLHVLAAGGFPLVDYRSDLDLIFEKDTVASYRSIEEAESKVEFYLKHDSDRLKIIDRARKTVLDRHTYRHRVDELIDIARTTFQVLR